MSAAICAISCSFIPWVVTAGVPMRTPLVTKGRARVVGDRVLVQRDAGPVEHLLRVLAR